MQATPKNRTRREFFKDLFLGGSKAKLALKYGPNVPIVGFIDLNLASSDDRTGTFTPKPSGTIRIGSFGGSTTYFPDSQILGVGRNDSYPCQLEYALNQHYQGNPSIEGNNLAFSGNSVPKVYDNLGIDLKGDYDFALVSEQWNFAERDGGPSGPPSPDSYGVNNTSPLTWGLVNTLVGVPYFGVTAVGFTLSAALLASTAHRHKRRRVLREGLQEMGDSHIAYLKAIDGICRSKNTQLVLGIHPDGWDPSVAIEERLLRVKIGGKTAWLFASATHYPMKRYLGTRIRNYSAESGIPLIDWETEFNNKFTLAERQAMFTPDLAHVNEQGAKAMAEIAADKFITLINKEL